MNDSIVSVGSDADKYYLLSMDLFKKYSSLPIKLTYEEYHLLKQKTIGAYKQMHPNYKNINRHGYSEVDLFFFKSVSEQGVNPFFTVN